MVSSFSVYMIDELSENAVTPLWLLMFFLYQYIVLSLHKLQINKCLLKLNTISHHYEYVTFSCRKSWVWIIMVWRETEECIVVGCINLTFIEENKWYGHTTFISPSLRMNWDVST